MPCLVVSAQTGPLPAVQGLSQLVDHGWAVFVYDPAGVGESSGDYQWAPTEFAAEDLRLAGEMLRARGDIDGDSLVVLALGDGAIVGARALANGGPFSGAVLGSFATDQALFPELAEIRVREALAPFYGWSPADIERYLDASVIRWQEWLFADEQEVSLLGRRADLSGLSAWQETPLPDLLAQAQVPVLILHGREDVWTPVAGAERLAEELAAPQADYTFRFLDGLGSDLGRGREGVFWSEQVDVYVFEWLDTRF